MVAPNSSSPKENNRRPIAQFHPSHWGNLFLNYTPDDEATRTKKENEIEELKEKVRKELFGSAEKEERELELIDAIQRLGIAYHFEEEFEHILQRIFHAFSSHDNAYQDEDLYHTSLRFRVLRQRGFRISSEILSKFKDETTGNFKVSLRSDVEGMLSLYEASHVRVHGEDILEEAFAFTKMHLINSMASNSLSSVGMREKVDHALKQPLHRGMTRLESRHYISMYELCDPLHDQTLLKLAKLDFNFLQSLHKTELKDIARWDKSSTNQLPDYMKFVYETLLSIFEEFEQDLVEEGRSDLIHYVKEQMKILCETYMQEAKWRNAREIPKYGEYVKNSGVSFGYDLGIAVSFLGMGKIATKEAFEWVNLQPKALVAIGVMGRLKNDMGGNQFQQGRDHVASAVECYMRENGVSEYETREALNQHVENTWKDVNEGMLRPHAIAWPLLSRILQLARIVDVLYDGEDGYTIVSQTIRDKIALVLIHQLVL